MTGLLSVLKELRLDGVRSCMESMAVQGDPRLAEILPLLSRLFEAEAEARRTAKTMRLLLRARFRYEAGVQTVLTGTGRNLEKENLERLSECRWIARGQNLLITGPTGAGKSWLACALGRQACELGYSTLYFQSSKLWSGLSMATKKDTYQKELKKISSSALLILDDFGLSKLDSTERLMFLEVLEDRWGRSSTVVVSQRPFAVWHEAIGEPTFADAICDRLFAGAEKIELKGESLRSNMLKA